jgi:hypothetical protein
MSSDPATTIVREAEESIPREDLTEEEHHAADVRHLLDLLERDAVEEARRYVKELEQRWPDSERVRHYAVVLAPPVARTRPDLKLRRMDREWEWLREHGHEYPGCWLAIHEDRLIAADPDRRVVVARAREVVGDEGVLLFRQPGSPKAK